MSDGGLYVDFSGVNASITNLQNYVNNQLSSKVTMDQVINAINNAIANIPPPPPPVVVPPPSDPSAGVTMADVANAISAALQDVKFLIGGNKWINSNSKLGSSSNPGSSIGPGKGYYNDWDKFRAVSLYYHGLGEYMHASINQGPGSTLGVDPMQRTAVVGSVPQAVHYQGMSLGLFALVAPKHYYSFDIWCPSNMTFREPDAYEVREYLYGP
jgi:hypothetical protein